MPPWTNIWLLMAMGLSFGLHFVLLYVDTLSVCVAGVLHFVRQSNHHVLLYLSYPHRVYSQYVHLMVTNGGL